MLVANVRQFGVSLAGLAPLAWLMAAMYVVAGPIGILPFAVPLYATRAGYKKVVEIRDMFTQTVRSLAGAVDAKDPYTAGHSERVQLIAKDLGAELHCSDTELEALEWGGLLHDIGKIGIPDAILLKAGALTKEERVVMNAHPVKGEEIMRPVEKLAPELPIIRHHHEWFNGSGYPDRLVGHEIPTPRADHARGRLVRGDDRRAAVPHDARSPRSRPSTSCTSSAASSSTQRSSPRSTGSSPASPNGSSRTSPRHLRRALHPAPGRNGSRPHAGVVRHKA